MELKSARMRNERQCAFVSESGSIRAILLSIRSTRRIEHARTNNHPKKIALSPPESSQSGSVEHVIVGRYCSLGRRFETKNATEVKSQNMLPWSVSTLDPIRSGLACCGVLLSRHNPSSLPLVLPVARSICGSTSSGDPAVPRSTWQKSPEQHDEAAESSIHHLKTELTRQKKLAERLQQEVEERDKEKRQVREKSSNAQHMRLTGMPVLILFVHELDSCATIGKSGNRAMIACDIVLRKSCSMPTDANHRWD